MSWRCNNTVCEVTLQGPNVRILDKRLVGRTATKIRMKDTRITKYVFFSESNTQFFYISDILVQKLKLFVF